MSFHFGLLGLHFFHFGLLAIHFLSFWPVGPSFPFMLAFWAFISFHFGLLGLHFLSFWPFGPSFFLDFGLLGLHFLSFWPFGASFPSFWLFGPSFPFILAFWRQIVGHTPRSPLTSPSGKGTCILVFWGFIFGLWAFISFDSGLLAANCGAHALFSPDKGIPPSGKEAGSKE